MRNLWTAIACAFVWSSAAAGQSRIYDFSKIDSELTRQCASGEFAGVVLVRAHGKDIFVHACGKADPVNGIENNRATRFKIFSTSKFISAIAIMQLVEDGTLRLDASIAEYLPDVPDAWRPVTIRHLLNHTSGIADWTESLFFHFRTDHSAAIRSTLTSLTDVQAVLKTRPGESFAYNNFGFELLAEAAARKTGKPFSTLVETLVFNPAGMKTAKVEAANMLLGHPLGVSEPGLAIGYNGEPSKLEQSTNYAFIQQGAGAVHATVNDFVALDKALAEGRLISTGTYAEMKRNPVPGTGRLEGRSFGLGIVISPVSGVAREGHTGGTNGYISDFERFPDDEAMMIALSNRGFAKTKWLRDGVAEVLKSAR